MMEPNANNAGNATSGSGDESKRAALAKHDLAVQEDLHLLRRRVDALSLEMDEKSKPWYKTFTGISGFLALLFSLFSIWYSYAKDTSASLESKRKEIRENLAEIMVLENEAEKQRLDEDSSMLFSSFVFSHPVFLNRFEVLLDNIDVINREIEGKLSTQTYNRIAEVYFNCSSRNDKAFEYYKYGLNAAKDALDSANTYLGLSMTYYANGVHFDSAKARDYFAKDVRQLLHSQYPNRYFLACSDYARAAGIENSFDEANSLRLLDSAKYYLNKFKGQPLYHDLAATINYNIIEMNTKLGRQYDTIPNR